MLYDVAQCSPIEYELNIEYGIGRYYRDIVYLFHTSGAVNTHFLSWLTVGNVKALRYAQSDSHILRQTSQISDEAALTMAAVKVLRKYFSDDA